jgi:hypothetical protein
MDRVLEHVYHFTRARLRELIEDAEAEEAEWRASDPLKAAHWRGFAGGLRRALAVIEEGS